MSPNPQQIAAMVTFTEEILNERLYFLCSSFRYRCVRACIPIYVRSVFCVLPLFAKQRLRLQIFLYLLEDSKKMRS